MTVRARLTTVALIAGAACACACASACADREPPPAQDPPGVLPCGEPYAPTDNPLDAELSIKMQAACLVAVPEEPAVLCRRAITDLLGRFPTEEEITARCLGKNYDDVVRELQNDPRYFLSAERFWTGPLDVQDFYAEAERVLDFYADVRALHKHELSYREFAIRAQMRPDVVQNPVNGFLDVGLAPEQSSELSRLFAMYRLDARPDRELPLVVSVFHVVIDPTLCDHVAGCKTTLLGGASIDFASTASVALADATPELLTKLRNPGELIANAPRFYESAADRLLNRFLDWDDGDVFPRTPGVLLPHLRQRLANELAKDGDYPRAERLVLTSWLYRQRARASESARPIWAVGPIKRARAETWLDSATRFAGLEIGTCDHRYRGHYYFESISTYAFREHPSFEEANAMMVRAHQRLESLVPLVNVGAPAPQADRRYTALAQSLGGCHSNVSPNVELAHEAAVASLCAELRPQMTGPASLEEVVARTMKSTIGRAPSTTEMEIIKNAITECIEPECSKSVCSTLLGAAEALYY